MYRIYNKLKESILDNLYREDQKERNRYKKYLIKYQDYKIASAKYANDFSRRTDDIFNDTDRLEIAKDYIKKNINDIVNSDNLKRKSWLLVQHMDNDTDFQEWFIKFLSENSEEYKYLYDRIQINLGKSQKYYTQDV